MPRKYCNVFSIIAWQSWFRQNRHFALCLCIKGDGTLYLHMRYSSLAYCICDFFTDWSIASYQEIFESIPVEDKLATHEIDYLAYTTHTYANQHNKHSKQHTSNIRTAN